MNRFIKLLLYGADGGFVLLYGFSISANVKQRAWTSRNGDNKKFVICHAVMTEEDALSFEKKLTEGGTLNLGKYSMPSPKLMEGGTSYSNVYEERENGPISNCSYVNCLWNEDKRATLSAVGAELSGKERHDEICDMLKWVKDESGLTLSKKTWRFGNFEHYAPLEGVGKFEIAWDDEHRGRVLRIIKKCKFDTPLTVSLEAEDNEMWHKSCVEIFPPEDNELRLSSEENMSRVILRIWESESGRLIYADDKTYIKSVVMNMSISQTEKRLSDPWVQKLYNSAANQSESIREMLERVRPFSAQKPFTVHSEHETVVDKIIKNSESLFSPYVNKKCTGAYISNGTEGEIEGLVKIREYLDDETVISAVIADPYFSVISAQKLLTRTQNANLDLKILMSLTDDNPDTGQKADACELCREFVSNNRALFSSNVTVINLTRGKKQVFHDRYLIRYHRNGLIDGFIMSNSVNSMAQKYPFVIAPLEHEVCMKVCDYLNSMCDCELQKSKPKKERIEQEIILQPQKSEPVYEEKDNFPAREWMLCRDEYKNSAFGDDGFADIIGVLEEKSLKEGDRACLAIGQVLSQCTGHEEQAFISALNSSEKLKCCFLERLPSLAKKCEGEHFEYNNKICGEETAIWRLLNDQAELSRRGIEHLLHNAAHLHFRGHSWLTCNYRVLLQLDLVGFITLLDELKSPFMLGDLCMYLICEVRSVDEYRCIYSSGHLAVKLICAQSIFDRVISDELSIDNLNGFLGALSPADLCLTAAFLLSKSTFYLRTEKNVESEKRYELENMQNTLCGYISDKAPLCTDKEQSEAASWLDDPECCSACQLKLSVASRCTDERFRGKVLEACLKTAVNALKSQREGRNTKKLVELLVDAAECLKGAEIEGYVLGVVDSDCFERASEPGLKNYAYDRWKKAHDRTEWQIVLLKECLKRNPACEKAKKLLSFWEERI